MKASLPPCESRELSWVCVSPVLTAPSWVSEGPSASGAGVVPSLPFVPQTFDCTREEDLEHSWRIRNLKGLKDLHVKGVTPYPASYMEGKWAAFNLRRFPRSATDEIVSTQLPTPSTTIGFGWPCEGDILKTLLEHWNGADAAWVNLKECLIIRRTSQAMMWARHYQNPPPQPRGRAARFWRAIVGPENLWPRSTLH